MFLGHSSATDMFQKITTCLTDNSVSMSKLVQLSMNGPNVNLKLHALMDEELCSETEGPPALLSAGLCGLPTVHNAFKAGANASERGIEDIQSLLY